MAIEVGCFSVTKSVVFEGFPCGQRAHQPLCRGGEWPRNDSYATGEFVTIPKPEGLYDRKTRRKPLKLASPASLGRFPFGGEHDGKDMELLTALKQIVGYGTGTVLFMHFRGSSLTSRARFENGSCSFGREGNLSGQLT
jgi:hypothetical protein